MILQSSQSAVVVLANFLNSEEGVVREPTPGPGPGQGQGQGRDCGPKLVDREQGMVDC